MSARELSVRLPRQIEKKKSGSAIHSSSKIKYKLRLHEETSWKGVITIRNMDM